MGLWTVETNYMANDWTVWVLHIDANTKGPFSDETSWDQAADQDCTSQVVAWIVILDMAAHAPCGTKQRTLLLMQRPPLHDRPGISAISWSICLVVTKVTLHYFCKLLADWISWIFDCFRGKWWCLSITDSFSGNSIALVVWTAESAHTTVALGIYLWQLFGFLDNYSLMTVPFLSQKLFNRGW